MQQEQTAGVWFSHDQSRTEPEAYCLVCWGYGRVVTRHRGGHRHAEETLETVTVSA